MNEKEFTTKTSQVKSDSEITQNQTSQVRQLSVESFPDLALEVSVEPQFSPQKFECDSLKVKLRSLSGEKLHVSVQKRATQIP